MSGNLRSMVAFRSAATGPSRGSARRQRLPALAARPRADQAPHPIEGELSTISPIEMQAASQPALIDRIALVRDQLAPIHSRRALLDSYRRESLCRLASPAQDGASAVEVLDTAYALRWAELAPDDAPMDPDEGP